MDSSIKLSIVVPVYNVEKYLEECLNSIIKNYIQGVEVVIVNDGSTDNSECIANKYTSKYDFIKLINRPNGGLSAARNTGIKEASGEYIWFVDSDDYIEDNSISDIFKEINKGKDIILGSYRQVFPDGNIYQYKAFNEDDNFNIAPYKYFYSLGNVSYAAVRFITKRKLILDNELFFTEGIYHEDEEWSPRVLCAAQSFSVVMNITYNYRVGNPNSIIGMSNPKKVLDKIFISNKLNKMIEDNNFIKDKNEFLSSRVAHNYIAALNECINYSGDTRKELVKELHDNIRLLYSSNSKKAKMIRNFIKTFGVLNTSRFLKFRSKI